MGLLRKFCSIFHDDWCSICQGQMNETWHQLYMLPMIVGHYSPHKSASYYKENLKKVNCKSEIPIGTYACGVIAYKCPKCNHKMTKLSIFLPVRNQEKYEDTVYFNNGELDDLVDFSIQNK